MMAPASTKTGRAENGQQSIGRRTVPHQATIGLLLAAGIMTSWIGLHVYGVYLHHWSVWSIAIAPTVIAAQTWLSVGLFIVAHDAMHGSLAPGRPGVNTTMGVLALGLYAGFRFHRLREAHGRHHAAPGTADDPDFHAPAPHRFVPWFVAFFRTYFGWREFAVLTVAVWIAVLVLRAPVPNLLVFWALPALLSALQLFVFGTWLPHRAHGEAFADWHNARSNGFPSWLSLLTCFHFGRHHEHHLQPWLPWWRLDDEGSTDRRQERDVMARARGPHPFALSDHPACEAASGAAERMRSPGDDAGPRWSKPRRSQPRPEGSR